MTHRTERGSMASISNQPYNFNIRNSTTIDRISKSPPNQYRLQEQLKQKQHLNLRLSMRSNQLIKNRVSQLDDIIKSKRTLIKHLQSSTSIDFGLIQQTSPRYQDRSNMMFQSIQPESSSNFMSYNSAKKRQIDF